MYHLDVHVKWEEELGVDRIKINHLHVLNFQQINKIKNNKINKINLYINCP